MMLMALLWILLAITVIRWLTTPDRSRLPAGEAERAEAEMARLRDDVDRLSQQMDRLLEEQSFLLRLLGDRKTEGAPLPPVTQPGEPNADT